MLQLYWDLYDAEVAGVDRQVGRVLDALDARADRDDVALVLAADHGEEFFESWARFGHGGSLTEGVVRVPLMLRAAGVAPGRQGAPVELLQVTPTALSLLGLAPPYALDGNGLLAEDPGRGFAVSFVSHISASARDAHHRYWLRLSPRPWTRGEDDGAPWRVDAPWFRVPECLAEYPGEDTATGTTVTAMRWIKPSEPDFAARAGPLKARLERLLAALPEAPETGTAEHPEHAAELQALGYLGTGDR